jgi:type I restriction enzyme M protein
MSELTKSLESATRKRIDNWLQELGWDIDEESATCNCFTERAKTTEQNHKFLRKKPDYVLYKSGSDMPIAIIEAKRKGESIDKAIKESIKKYANPINVDIVFAVDGTFVKAFSVSHNSFLTIDDEQLSELISEKKLLRFIDEGHNIKETNEIIKHSRGELIKIFRWANDLLRKEGLRNLDRFVEFANILFIKIMSEIESEREVKGEDRRLDSSLCWESFAGIKEAKTMLNYINNSVLKNGFAKKYNHSDDIFQDTLKIKNPLMIKEIVNKLSRLTLLNTESEIKGDAFEYFLKELASGNDLGEYFTPRHIVKLMINLVNPKYGQIVYDPCCGTGGFLIEAFRNIKKSCNINDRQTMKKLTEETIYGVELTDTYKIAKMNMIIIGDGHNNIVQGDSLSNQFKKNDYFDVILTNPPYSQQTDYGEHFPIPSKQADPIFLQHIILSLKESGTAAVIVPEGLLFRKDKNFQNARKYLLEKCNIQAVISLPGGTFLPYTDVKTDIVIFSKGRATEKVWFYEIINDGFELNKNRKPIGASDIPDLLEKWQAKPTSKRSFLVDVDKIKKNNFSLKLDDYKRHKKIKSKYPLIKIGDLAELTTGSSAPQDKDYFHKGKYPFVRVNDLNFIENWKYIVKTKDKINDKAIKEKHLVKSSKKSVIFPKSGISLLHNKRAILSEDCYIVNHFAILKPDKKKIHHEYLYYVLKNIDMGQYANRTTLPSLNLSAIKEIKIPLPPLNEQKRIVAEFNKQERKITKLKEKEILYKKSIKTAIEDLFKIG